MNRIRLNTAQQGELKDLIHIWKRAAADVIGKSNSDFLSALQSTETKLLGCGTFQALKDFKNVLVEEISEKAGLPIQEALARIDATFAERLRTAEWKKYRYEVPNLGQAGIVVASELIPLNSEAAHWSKFGYGFTHYGMTGKPASMITSASTEAGRLANAWITALKVNEADVFRAIRSGSVDHYREANPVLRAQHNAKAAQELLFAAVMVTLERQESDKLTEIIQGARPLPLKVLSIDLQSSFGKTFEQYENPETQTVPNQFKELRKLNTARHLTIKMRPTSTTGETTLTIPVTVKALAVNFPTHQREFQGNYGESAETYAANRIVIRELLKEARQTIKALEDAPHVARISVLSDQVEKLFDEAKYKEATTDHYAIQARIALLAYELGYTVHFNCRSGKDRTGMLDAAIKLLAFELHQGRSIELDQKLNDSQSAILFELVTKGGGTLIQLHNTGVPGNKLGPITAVSIDDPFVARLGSLERWHAFKGLSHLASS